MTGRNYEAGSGQAGIRFIDTTEELDQVFDLPAALLFKHSTRCGTSRRALAEVERYSREDGALRVFGIDVIRHRGLSRQAAERLGIRHESPQAILIRSGAAAWDASHHRVTAERMRTTAEEVLSDEQRRQTDE
ncbi:MAG: bacillithiol system redox-active protein YtxJ [marine benthic group bacterium]|jgi:bacillithiol system protein YtxJ|nr:bacillithiol system redox-active protein YtxJ [Candidatus Benthicola marisminoris]